MTGPQEQTTDLDWEVSAILDEFFPYGLVPSRTDAVIAGGNCRLIDSVELANEMID